MKGKESVYEAFYVPSNATVKELKTLVCKEFDNLEDSKYTLYRVNYLEEPVFPLRRENQELVKCHVGSGDLLIIQGNAETNPEDKLTLNIHLTMTGQPEDSQFLDKIEVSREYTLRDLKDVILSMKAFEFAKDLPLEQIRVREKQRNMFFGKIFRDTSGGAEKTLKNHSINTNSQLVIQVLQEPEYLELNTMILLACKRNVAERTYGPKVEFKFTYPEKDVPKIADLEV
jgi:hypothetical protein